MITYVNYGRVEIDENGKENRTAGRNIYVDGQQIPDPPCDKGAKIIIEDDTIYVGGYEWNGKSWERSFKAFLKCVGS